MNVAGWISEKVPNRFLRTALVLASANVMGQFLLLAITPIVSRLYTPSDFGIFAVFGALLGVVLVASSLRYELAIPLMRNDSSARSVLTSALEFNVLTSLGLLVVILFWARDFARAFQVPEAANYLFILPIGVLAGGTYRAANMWALRKGEIKSIAQTKLVQSATNGGLQLGLGFLGAGALGLIVGHTVGFAAGGFRLLRNAGFNVRGIVSSQKRKRGGMILIRHRRFPMFDAPAALVNTLNVQLPNLVLGIMFSPAVAGIYFLAERVFTTPMAFASQALGHSLLASSRELVGKGGMLRQATLMAGVLTALVAVPTLVVMLTGEHIFAWVFGESWRDAGIYAGWLVAGYSAQFVYSSISTSLTATSGQGVNLAIHTCLLAAKSAALLVGYRIGSPMAAIISLSVVNVVGNSLAVFAILAHLSRSEAISKTSRREIQLQRR